VLVILEADRVVDKKIARKSTNPKTKQNRFLEESAP
jgi:hypothetical protein